MDRNTRKEEIVKVFGMIVLVCLLVIVGGGIAFAMAIEDAHNKGRFGLEID